MIEARELCKNFKDKKRGVVKAVDKVSFTCKAGEVYGLLGPNGAGKTTTLRILSTALKPTSGTAIINGTDVTVDPQKCAPRSVSLSGNTGLYGRLTAREWSPTSVILWYGKQTIRRRTDELFALLDMKDFADSRNEKLSTGMKQKVSIVRSVLHDPPVMVFDEPTSGLDVMSSRTIVDFIKHCRDSGKCVIFSTHIMSEAMRLCDRVAIIHNGRIYREGTVNDLLQATGQNNLEDAFIKIVGE
jgi:sodium transport system ATP-binding protein